MEFDPPIASRETDELIEIANFIEKWDRIAVEQAKKELEVRGISKELQNKKIKQWNLLVKQKLEIELARRKEEGYDILSLIIMSFKWPFTMLFEWHLKKDGYLRMHRQRRMSILSGILFWAFVFWWATLSPFGSLAKWQEEVDNVDISEWEEEFYSGAEINEQTIKMAIHEIEVNQKENVKSIVLINSDTSSLEDLKSLEYSSTKNVELKYDFEPSYVFIVEISTK